ncbi:MAG: hypothetical protein ETSY1_39425 [Candidatus Entotheonella factor]|uniref:Calcium-binding protein n=1 Tax=Entotheonella factor TaxID=1429438 RepID=W4L5N6_ENTF1|nr:MAG: hypothetical protein ETSY1_39425 [Candidatus Entotheonella factor]
MRFDRMRIWRFSHQIGVAIVLSVMVALNVQVQFNQEQKLTASDAMASDVFGLSASLDGDRLVVGALVDDNGNDSGTAYVFERQGDGTWLEVAKLTASNAAAGDLFGERVSLSGDRIAVGARSAANGTAYVFERQGDGTWQEAAILTASDGGIGGDFGVSVSLSNDRLVVGNSLDDDSGEDSGAAHVFERQGDGTWQEVAKLTASNAAAFDNFGLDVSLSSDRLVVGTFRGDGNVVDSGAAYVFERQGDGTWQEVAILAASDAVALDFVGSRVSLSGDRIVAGARGNDDNGPRSGAAYIFDRQGDGTWQEAAKLTASDAAAFDSFGNAVSLSGDRLIVGAVGVVVSVSPGAAYVFERQGDGTWQEAAKLTASDAAPEDNFGRSVSLSGNRIAIGANLDDDNGSASGSAYVFAASTLPPSSCDCANATIEGTGGNDKLIGTPGDDIICGFGGNDRIFGEGGNDCLDGGSGNDRLFGGNGNDRLLGRAGNDHLRGGAGNDFLNGNADDDVLHGGDGNDVLTGQSGNDTLRGDAGEDDLSGGSGEDNLRGGSDDDVIKGDSGDDFLRGDDGNDILQGGTGEDVVDGDSGDDDLRGGSDSDIIKGDDGNDLLEGNGGNDMLRGGAGDDDLRGGAGGDDLSGGAGNDFIRGDSGNDVLRGGSGDDELNGGSNNDILRGDSGNDFLQGGAGRDSCRGGQGMDASDNCEETNGIP